jgi:predicted RND superfamily exporter protein
MQYNVIIGTTGGTFLSVILGGTFFTTCLTAAIGATVAFFISLFWKYAMGTLDERIEIEKRLKQLVPLIKRKRALNKKIDKIKHSK